MTKRVDFSDFEEKGWPPRLSWSLESVPPRSGFLAEDHPPLSGFDEWSGSSSWGRSTTHAFDDPGKPKAGVGEAVEVVLALAATIDDSPVPQQGHVVAHGGLGHVELVAPPPDMALPLGERGDDPEPG